MKADVAPILRGLYSLTHLSFCQQISWIIKVASLCWGIYKKRNTITELPVKSH